MTIQSVNYDNVADVYNYRYQQTYSPDGIAQKLINIACQTRAKRILEVGCGTGHWIEILQNQAYTVGLDCSYGMLKKVNPVNGSFSLIQADSSALPFTENSFDFIFCVNAFHHFQEPQKFIQNATNLLTKNGILAIIGLHPQSGTDDWFVYDFFPQTRETDLHRFPSSNQIVDWMSQAKLNNAQKQLAEQLKKTLTLEEVLCLPKEYTSQLSLLSDQQYEEGLNKIRDAATKDNNRQFNVDLSIVMVTAERY